MSGITRRFMLIAAVATALTATVAPTASAAVGRAAAVSWRTAREILPPADGSTIYDVVPQALSCAAENYCVTGGYLESAQPSGSGFVYHTAIVATESGGRWRRFVTLQLPSDAIAGNLTAQVTSVSCPAKNFCAAVGYYTGTATYGDQVHAFLATDAGGTWSRATIPPVPGGQSGASGLYSVSCPATSYCVAVGSFGGAETPGGMPFSVTYRNGKWQASSRPALPASMTADEIESMGVSCHSARDCVAVGTAYNISHGNDTGLQWVDSRGRWGRPSTTRVPSAADRGTGPDLASVSCSAATSCIAVGHFVRHGGNTPLQVVLSNGRWQRGLWVPRSSALNAVSCTSWHCVAVGQYDAGYGSLVVSERHGAELGSPVHIHLPSNAIPNHDNEQLNGLTAVSCLGRSWCAAVGYYSGPAPGRYLAMVSTS